MSANIIVSEKKVTQTTKIYSEYVNLEQQCSKTSQWLQSAIKDFVATINRKGNVCGSALVIYFDFHSVPHY